ncbi:XK-related protein 5a [Latimeria chalumnae]|uniref:XK-related protein 5a n=1 Tax=Latimeria chalumnae TaxID=7897 RepID=UPI0006D8EDDC|nr:PREDICTED: XK-related protein 5 [Latimeria chalumnae]|eukprot:XP_014351855.1 PREDICTED: XK-related protein 5 [Latimeria chalumnae]
MRRLCAPLLLPAERAAYIYTGVQYLLIGQYLWAGLTFALLLPACSVQVLSLHWFRADGHRRGFLLTIVHVLQLGILKRYWDSLSVTFLKPGELPVLGDLLAQQGDLSVLRLLEAFLLSLPQLVLQTYLFVAAQTCEVATGVSAGLSLLSLSWALVSYSRAMCLLKPGHLGMPAAALLCQLLWRLGMLASRVLSLVLFARVFHFWVFAVAAVHWVMMSFWMVALQSDIFSGQGTWRLFNCAVGAVYVFCFVNVKDGPSRYRLVTFYTIMVLENATLLLLVSDFLQEASWDSVKMVVAVLSGFLIGCVGLITYYSFLHPKSMEISQSFRKASCGAWSRSKTTEHSLLRLASTSKLRNSPAAATCSPPVAEDIVDPKHSRTSVHSDLEHSRMPGKVDLEHTTTLENNDLEYSRMVTDVTKVCSPVQTCMDLEPSTTSNLEPTNQLIGADTANSHHHWLLLKLALKTGNVSKMNTAFGEGGIGHTFPSITEGDPLDPNTVRKSSSNIKGPLFQSSPSLPKGEHWNEPIKQKMQASSSMYISLPSNGLEHKTMELVSSWTTREPDGQGTEDGPNRHCSKEARSYREGDDDDVFHGNLRKGGAFAFCKEDSESGKAAKETPGDVVSGKEREKENNSTLYYSASTEGFAPHYGSHGPVHQPITETNEEVQNDLSSKRNQLNSGPQGMTLEGWKPLVTFADISPIPGRAGGIPAQTETLVGVSSLSMEPRQVPGSGRGRLGLADEPCFTSTPKTATARPERDRMAAGMQKQLTGLTRAIQRV